MLARFEPGLKRGCTKARRPSLRQRGYWMGSETKMMVEELLLLVFCFTGRVAV